MAIQIEDVTYFTAGDIQREAAERQRGELSEDLEQELSVAAKQRAIDEQSREIRHI